MSAQSYLPLVALAALPVVALTLLWLLFLREQVKKDLRQQGFTPIRVRWRPFAFWALYYSSGFNVLCADPANEIHRLRCRVSNLDLRVRWIDPRVRYLEDLPGIGRVVYGLLMVLLLGFGVRCLAAGKLVLPATLRHPKPVRLQGLPLSLLAAAALCGAGHFLTVLLSQYAGEESKRPYELVARGLSWAGWGLFLASLVVYTCALAAS
jgi:hypothetical protein